MSCWSVACNSWILHAVLTMNCSFQLSIQPWNRTAGTRRLCENLTKVTGTSVISLVVFANLGLCSWFESVVICSRSIPPEPPDSTHGKHYWWDPLWDATVGHQEGSDCEHMIAASSDRLDVLGRGRVPNNDYTVGSGWQSRPRNMPLRLLSGMNAGVWNPGEEQN